MQYHKPLNDTQIPFDNKTLNYDINRHPLPMIVLTAIQKYYSDVTSLDTLHEVIPADKLADTMSRVSNDLINTDFYNHFDTIVQEMIVPKIGSDVLIQKFGNVRALIPEQDKIGAVLLWHQGRWVGNGLGLRTIWMPFTDCFESNSMQILDLDASRDITRQTIKENWSYEKLDQVCTEKAWPVTLAPGQAHLFFQEHIHGNVPNRTDKTRVSIDIRILVRNGQPHRKWPGAYFRQLFDRTWNKVVPVLPNEIAITYSEYEGSKTRHIDLFLQTHAIKWYCNRRGITFPYQHGDNEGTNYAHLNHLISNTNIDHLLLFSIFSLPDDAAKRQKIITECLNRKIRVHFCNEELVLETAQDFEKIEFLRTFTDDWSSPVEQLREELQNF